LLEITANLTRIIFILLCIYVLLTQLIPYLRLRFIHPLNLFSIIALYSVIIFILIFTYTFVCQIIRIGLINDKYMAFILGLAQIASFITTLVLLMLLLTKSTFNRLLLILWKLFLHFLLFLYLLQVKVLMDLLLHFDQPCQRIHSKIIHIIINTIHDIFEFFLCIDDHAFRSFKFISVNLVQYELIIKPVLSLSFLPLRFQRTTLHWIHLMIIPTDHFELLFLTLKYIMHFLSIFILSIYFLNEHISRHF